MGRPNGCENFEVDFIAWFGFLIMEDERLADDFRLGYGLGDFENCCG